MNRFRSESECDLLVIGGGPAGLVAAKTAASLKARVTLVERDQPGGLPLDWLRYVECVDRSRICRRQDRARAIAG